MNDKQTIMKFELLPNEIIIESLEYLNACDIFHSFDQLNHRFNHLIRNIPLCINFQGVNKSIFDEFCTKMLQNPEMKNQVYSLSLPADPGCFQTKRFLSFFSYEEFNNLQNFDSTSILAPDQRYCTKESNSELDAKIKQAGVLFSKLRKLSILELEEFLRNTNETPSITSLTLSRCNLNEFSWLGKCLPMLKYLQIKHIDSYGFGIFNEFFTGPHSLYLQKLVIHFYNTTFERFRCLIVQTPNLKSLTIFSCSIAMVDADRWEQLITSSLPYLQIFKFEFSSFSYKPEHNFIIKFKQFQSDFWQKKHQWFTEYIIGEDFAAIYTIPYSRNAFKLPPNQKRYWNNLKKNVNVFINVTDLILFHKLLTKNCEFYFPNVTHLILTAPDMNSFELDIPEDRMMSTTDFHSSDQPKFKSLTIEHIEYLKMIVNLSNLQHLDIFDYSLRPISSSVLLTILKQASRLCSLRIDWHQLIFFLKDIQLCKYFNKMMNKLYIVAYYDNIINQSFQIEHFSKVFVNIEHLQCVNGHADKLIFVINHLPKLSTVNLEWKSRHDPKADLFQFENQTRQQNIMCHINIERQTMNDFTDYYTDDEHFNPENMFYYTTIFLWSNK